MGTGFFIFKLTTMKFFVKSLIIRSEDEEEPDKRGYFLCTYDTVVNPGDQFFYDKGIDPAIQDVLGVDENYIYSRGRNDEIHNARKYCVKVLGPISPEAIWVEDRLKLNSEQFEIHVIVSTNPIYTAVCAFDRLEGDKKLGYKYFFKILCPICKTFH